MFQGGGSNHMLYKTCKYAITIIERMCHYNMHYTVICMLKFLVLFMALHGTLLIRHFMTGFTQSSGLAAHARSHSALSGYQCARCPRAFPTISERRRHQSAHGVANLPCPHCHRRFSRTNDLVRHSRVHERR